MLRTLFLFPLRYPRVTWLQGYCLDVGPWVGGPRACDVEPGMSMPFCDTTLSLADRVQSLVANLTRVLHSLVLMRDIVFEPSYFAG